MCDTYVSAMNNAKLTAWKDNKLDGDNVREEDMQEELAKVA